MQANLCRVCQKQIHYSLFLPGPAQVCLHKFESPQIKESRFHLWYRAWCLAWPKFPSLRSPACRPNARLAPARCPALPPPRPRPTPSSFRYSHPLPQPCKGSRRCSSRLAARVRCCWPSIHTVQQHSDTTAAQRWHGGSTALGPHWDRTKTALRMN